MLTFICMISLVGPATQPNFLLSSDYHNRQALKVYFDQADVQSFEEDTHKKYASNDALHVAVCNNLQLALEISASQ